MAAGKPFLATNVLPVKRIVDQFKCGLIYKDNEEGEFISQLIRLRDHEERKRIGHNGMRAVQESCNWDKDSAEMMKSLMRFWK